MKPLKLKISGINSFIEEETIDFLELTSLGLFGIFGPTGSGKSTILDAITLALYGEIPRSGKDLSGIVNSHCDRGYVDYEFMIGSKGSEKTYWVHRAYKKDKEGSIKTHAVKLYDITDRENPDVLEERVTAVNNAIIDIIGLKGNDFTRSVVLPQGNFSEFLKLGGKEKRDMLERIFALQEYGSNLTQKVYSHKRGLTDNLNFIEGKLKTFEGISKESYDNLVKEIKTLEEEYKKQHDEYETIKKTYEDNKELYGLTKEFKEYSLKDQRLKGQKEDIEKDKKAYELAQKAKGIKPYIDQNNQLDNKLKDTEGKIKENKIALEKTKTSLEKVEKQFKMYGEKKEKQIPKLLIDRNSMEGALEKTEKLKELSNKFQGLKKEEGKYQVEIKEIKNHYEKTEIQIRELIEQLKEDREMSEKLLIPPKYREKLYQGQNMEKEYKAALKEERNIDSKIKELLSEISPLNRQKEKLDNDIKKLEASNEKLGKDLKTLEDKINHIEKQNMAASLAASLEEGHTCPVCGSKDHPIKAEFIKSEELGRLKIQKDQLNKDLENTQTALKDKAIELQEDIKNLSQKQGFLNQLEDNLENLKVTIKKQKANYLTTLKELKIKEIAIGIRELNQRDNNIEILHKNIKSNEIKKDKLQEDSSNTHNLLSNKNNQLTKIIENLKALEDRIIEMKKEIERICGEKSPKEEIGRIDKEIKATEDNYKTLKNQHEKYSEIKLNLEKDQRGLIVTLEHLEDNISRNNKLLTEMIKESKFNNIEEVEKSHKTREEAEALKRSIDFYQEELIKVRENLKRLETRMKGKSIDEEGWRKIESERKEAKENLEAKNKEQIKKRAFRDDIREKLREFEKIVMEKKDLERERGLIGELESLFRGNTFVEFISMGQLKYIAREASKKLNTISRGKYELELDGEGNFVIRDDFNGGIRRGTQTLSGGETFLTSLALALALSSHIQLKGKVPLEFFFLDEGFGTLDSELLEVVMDSLEKLHSKKLSVGLISHVEELKERMPRKLIIQPAKSGISGTKVILE